MWTALKKLLLSVQSGVFVRVGSATQWRCDTELTASRDHYQLTNTQHQITKKTNDLSMRGNKLLIEWVCSAICAYCVRATVTAAQ